MGMDGVEIVMAVEERFGITIDDRDAEKILTPRMLIDLIVAQTAHLGGDVCRSQRGFAITRRFLMTETGATRRDVALDVPLRKFVAAEKEANFWNKLRKTLDAHKWPKLDFPREGEVIVAVSWRFSLPQLFRKGDGHAPKSPMQFGRSSSKFSELKNNIARMPNL
jgi:hypothetical protein